MTNDFDGVLAMGEAGQRALLDGPDARDRLWAMWALALQHGSSVLVEHLAGEPSAGVRRHMCIMLAGGELDLLVAMARFDPDDGVRATASGLIARLAGGGRLPWPLALERLEDPASRAAVLEELGPLAPRELADVALRFARDEDTEVALAATDALFRMAPAVATSLVVDRLAHADDRRAHALLALWARHSAAPAIHEALRAGALAGRLAAVRHFANRWADVAPVATDADARVRAAVRRAFQQRLSLVALEVLATWIGDDAEHGWILGHALLGRLRRGERLPPGTNLLARCRRRLAALPPSFVRESGATALAVVDDEDDNHDPQYDERACLQSLVALVEALN